MQATLNRTVTILVVEDDDAIAALIRAILNEVPGWGTIVVHDAHAARAVLRHVCVESVVLDVDLPTTSGTELLAQLRSEPLWAKVPAVLMSAGMGRPEIQAAVEGGQASTFVAKPFDVDELVSAVRSAMRAQETGAPPPPTRRSPRGLHM